MYEQPDSAAYAGMRPAAYFALVTHVADMADTEKRQAFAQQVTRSPDEYEAFMRLVQGEQTKTGDDRYDQIERASEPLLTKLLANDLAKQKHADLKRAESGFAPMGLTPGSDFLYDGSDDIVAVWGDGDDVLLAEGEAMMLVGSPGVGKTTVANQFIRARLGCTDKALGFSVKPTASKVLYLACDRPRQARRALRRIFTADDAQALNNLVVWQGPPAEDFAAHPDALLKLCLEAGADTVVVDSLKDVVQGDIATGEVGAAYNRARQLALVNGIVILELHHQVKRGQNGGAPNTLADVYGSAWITAGAGSVVILDGEAGDPVVKWRHLKQPLSTVGPFDLYHDHETGVSSFGEKADLVALASRTAITVMDAAKVLFDTDKPTKSNRETARRRLDKLVSIGKLKSIPAPAGGSTVYTQMSAPEWTPTKALDTAPAATWDAQQLD